MATLTQEQYERWHKAKRAGDEELMKSIEQEGYGGVNRATLEAQVVEKSEPAQLPTKEEIEAMREEGMKDGEIGDQYGVSRQKISSIMKIGE